MSRILENLPIPLKKAKRRGIFLLNKEEKKKLTLASKKKVLNRKQKRKNLLKTMMEDEEKKENNIQNEIKELQKEIEGEKGKMVSEPPKQNESQSA